jgi:diguanylate cyclase (GGDEF)-like protein
MPAAISVRPPTRTLAAVGDILLGTDPVGRRALMRWALTAQCYAVALFLLFVGVQRGMASLVQAQFVALYCTLGILAFYVALRARWFASSRDPTLTFPMALFSISAIVLSYSLTELSRAASLQLLFLLVVFEMPRLTQRQTNIITFGATGMLMASLGFMTIRAAPGFDLHNEIFNVVMAGVMLPVLSMVAREVRQLRRRQVEQRADLQNTLTRLSELSIRDPLTGLYNRRHLLTILEEEAKRLRRSGHVFSVAMVDLDLFKGINDNFGHLVGDAVLREFSMVASDVLRTTDAIGRWGGEEFVLMLYHTDAEPAMLAMERLRQAVARHDWGALAPKLHVSFSAGVCLHEAGTEISHTLEQADRALYAAKAAGRNRTLSSETLLGAAV